MTWMDWESQGGVLTSGPAACSSRPGRLDVFSRSTDCAVWHRARTDGAWGEWERIGGTWTSAPAAVSPEPGRIDLFARGLDCALWHAWSADGAWSAWERLGGLLGDAPAVCSSGPGRLDVLARGTDGALSRLAYDGAWGAWERVGGSSCPRPRPRSPGAPAGSTSWPRARTARCGSCVNEDGWSDWERLGDDVLIGAPGVASPGPGRLEVFAAGTDSALWQRSYDGSWGAWTSLGGAIVSPPAAVSLAAGGVEVLAAGPDSALWQRAFAPDPEPEPEPEPDPGPPPAPALFVRREAWGLQAARPVRPDHAGLRPRRPRDAGARARRPDELDLPGRRARQRERAAARRDVGRVPARELVLPLLAPDVPVLLRADRARGSARGGRAGRLGAPVLELRPARSPRTRLPPAFRTPALPDGRPNPLCLTAPKRNAAVMAGGRLPPAATSAAAALARTNFAARTGLPSFGGGRSAPAHFGSATGLLEFTPHNNLHGTIGGPGGDDCGGGLMTDPRCAALDPIFWLHHANIDRLWNDWLALGGARANPADAPWLTQSFVFHDETGAEVAMTGAEVVDSAAQLGYVYDNVTATSVMSLESTSAAEPPEPSGPPELAAATDGAVELAGRIASVALNLPESMRGTVVAAAEDDARRMLISVEDIEGERNPGTTYAVYLDTPGATTDVTRERRHIGNVSFFGIEVMNDPDRPHDGAPGLRHVFDATDAVDALREQGRWAPDAVEVTFEPLEVLPPPGGELPAESGVAAAEPIRVGRVALFVA